MKRIFLTLLSLPLWCLPTVSAQFDNPTPSERALSQATSEVFYAKNRAMGLADRTGTVQSFSRNGKITSTQKEIIQFDEWGREIRHATWNKKGKLVEEQNNGFDREGNLIFQATVNGKGKTLYRKEAKYEGNLPRVVTRFSGSRIQWRNEYDFDSEGFKIQTLRYGKKGKFKTKTLFTYHEDGSKKRTEVYNKKGKLIRATDFSCDAKGAAIPGHKLDQIQVCERWEVVDGRKLKVIETFHYNKEDWRQIIRMNEQGHYVDITTFNERGEISGISEFSLDGEGRTTRQEYWVGDHKSASWSREWTYNEKGGVASERTYLKGSLSEQKTFSETYR